MGQIIKYLLNKLIFIYKILKDIFIKINKRLNNFFSNFISYIFNIAYNTAPIVPQLQTFEILSKIFFKIISLISFSLLIWTLTIFTAFLTTLHEGYIFEFVFMWYFVYFYIFVLKFFVFQFFFLTIIFIVWFWFINK